MAQTDWELIEACRQGDAYAWDALLIQYERLVYSIPLNYGLSLDDAADIAQITFTILLQSLDNLHPNSRLAPWLATVAKRHTWRVLAREQRETNMANDDSRTFDLPDTSHLRHLERWELLQWLHQGLQGLAERCRRLLLLLYFDEERPSYADIAQMLSIPLGSIGPTRARCLQRLKKLLADL